MASSLAVPEGELVDRLAELVERRMGLSFSEGRRGDLWRGVERASARLGFDDPHECAERMLQGDLTNEQLNALAGQLTVGETYFFRELRSLEALERRVLPELIAERRGRQQRLRIWSAGCSTGEEAYTIAMMIERLLGDLKGWTVTILATDINRSALQMAERGIYRPWSLRSVQEADRRGHFMPRARDLWQVEERYRRMVSFAPLNLVDDDFPSLSSNTNSMDVIFCRNVLMYFSREVSASVVARLRRALVTGGWLLTSITEVGAREFSGFEPVGFPGSVLYRKASRGTVSFDALLSSGGGWDRVAPSEDTDGKDRTADPSTSRGGAPTGSGTPAAYPDPGAKGPGGERPKVGSGAFRPGAFPGVELGGKGVDRSSRPPEGGAQSRGDDAPDSALHPAPSDEKQRLAEARERFCEGSYDEAIEILMPGGRDRGAAGDGLELAHEAHATLGRCFANLGRLGEALRWCERAVEGDKTNAAYRYLKGMILREQGDLSGARASLRQAICLDPGLAVAHFAAGCVELQDGREEGARRHFRNALDTARGCLPEVVLPESDGLTATRLIELIEAMGQGDDGR